MAQIGAVRAIRACRPTYLLSHLVRCGCCSGGFSKISRDRYGCSNARNRGACENLPTIRRDVLEESVLSGLRSHLPAPELLEEFTREYVAELNRLNRERDAGRAKAEADLAKVTRQVRAIIEAIKEGIRTPGMKEELLELEARKAALEKALRGATHGPCPASRMADLYQDRVARLHAELNRPDVRAQATEILRSLIEEIRLVPENGRLEIEVVGDLAGILALGGERKQPAVGDGGLQVTLVEGTRNHRELTLQCSDLSSAYVVTLLLPPTAPQPRQGLCRRRTTGRTSVALRRQRSHVRIVSGAPLTSLK